MGWVIPSEQSFRGGDPPVSCLDDRLVLGSQFPSRQRAPQVVLQVRPLGGPIQLAQVHDLVPGAPFALGLVHGRIRILQDLLRELIASTRERDTGARRHVHRDTRQYERYRHRRDDPGGDRVDLRRLVQVFAEDDELVARKAGQRVAWTHGEDQPLSDGHEQLVADGVAIQVVHLLEAVEIREEDRSPVARPSPPANGRVEPLDQEGPIGQTGQRVVQCQLQGSIGGVS